MNNDLQWCWQPNPVKVIVWMAIVAFAFALWVNSLGAPKAQVTLYDRHSFITANPFDRKFHIQGGGESGNKIGISRTENYTQSGAGGNSSLGRATKQGILSPAPSNFESRLMAALKTHVSNHDLVILPPDRPDTIEVYGYILEGPGGAFFMIDSIRPDNKLTRETVEHTLEKEKVFVSRPQAPYTVLFVRGQDVNK